MYKDNSKDDKFPKTLLICNHEGGLVWQVYHVSSIKETEILSKNAHTNGFLGNRLENYDPSMSETWPGWRDTPEWEKCLNS